MGETLVCVVCGGAVGPGDGVCPTCAEPRVRICACTALVTLDHRECPACGHVLPRFITMDERRRRKRRRNLWIAAGALAVLGTGAALARPKLLDARRADDLLTSGEAALAAGRAADAVRDLTEHVRLRPGDAAGMRALSFAHLAAGDTDAGVECALRALTLDPELPGVRLALARHFESLRDVLEAIRHARAAPEAAAHDLAGRLLTSLGRRVEAAAEHDAAVRAAPDDLEIALAAAAAHAALGEAEWVQAPRHRERADSILDDVVRRADARVSAHPGDSAAAGAALRALVARRGADPAAVDAAGRRAIEARADAAARIAWAGHLARTGRGADAAGVLGDVPAAGAAPEILVRRARALVAAVGEERALRDLATAARTSPDDEGCAAAYARVLLDAGRAADAAGAAAAARSAGNAGSPLLLDVAGEASAAAGDLDAAEKHLVAWRGGSPRDPRPLRRLLDLRMPDVLAAHRAGLPLDERTRTAVTRLAELGELDAEDPRRLFWSAEWDDANGRPERARRSADALTRATPDDPAARALRIRRAFAPGPPHADAPEAVAAEIRERACASDAHALAEAALAAGRLDLATDVAATVTAREGGTPESVSAVARAVLALGRPAGAAELFARTSPAAGDAEWAATRAVALALAGRADDAAAAGDAPAASLAEIARALGCAGRADDARRLAATAQERAGRDARSLVAVARAFDDLGLAADARAAWSAAERASPGDPSVAEQATVSLLLQSASSADERAEAARRVTELRDRTTSPLASMALRGVFAFARGEDAVAIDDLEHALRGLDGRPDVEIVRARALARGGHLAEAARALQKTLRAVPASVAARDALEDVLTSLALRALADGRISEAFTALEDLAAVRAPAVPRGPLEAVPAVPARAVAAARAALERDADAPGASLLLALDAARSGRAAQAEALAGRVTESRADLPGGPIVRALVLRAAGRADAAAEDLAAAVARGALVDDAALAAVLVGGAAPADDAVEQLREVAGTSPDRPRFRSWLVAALVARGQSDAALAEFEGLLAAAPDEAARWDLHAWGRDLAAAGRAEAARTALRRALVLDPAHAAAAASREALDRLR